MFCPEIEYKAEIERLNDEVDRLENVIASLREAQNDRRRDDKRNDSANDDNSDMGSVAKSEVLNDFEATFYTAFCPTGCIGITATGIDVSNTIYHEGKRIIAVDPGVISLGSIVKVTLESGQSFEATAQDVGGNIKGKRIDVLVASRNEAFRLGRQSAKVEIIAEGER